MRFLVGGTALTSFHLLQAAIVWMIGFRIFVKSQVLEVDESFQEKKKDFAWLLEFYAPWCGHCKRLEPIYHQVYLGLKGSSIIVAKIDATKYPGIASTYEVHGYPSIKFIQGSKVISYNGDRTKEDILEFARKASGPPVQIIKSEEQFSETLRQLSQNVFFIYVTADLVNIDTQADFVYYKQAADVYAITNSFYLLDKGLLPENIFVSKLPTVFVWKDDEYFEFGGKKEALESWIKVERFSAFPVVRGVGLNEMASLDKILIIYVDSNPESEWYIAIKKLAYTKKMLHERYQFVWLRDVDVGNNIVMSNMEGPFIFLFNSSDHSFFQYPLEFLSEESFMKFLENVESGLFKASGGKGLLERTKRLVYDIVMTMNNIYRESAWLSLFVFGVPLFVISIIFYSLCCIEPIEDDVIYEDFAADFGIPDDRSEDGKKIQ